jgi:diphthamide biosynthesis methyltransferase
MLVIWPEYCVNFTLGTLINIMANIIYMYINICVSVYISNMHSNSSLNLHCIWHIQISVSTVSMNIYVAFKNMLYLAKGSVMTSPTLFLFYFVFSITTKTSVCVLCSVVTIITSITYSNVTHLYTNITWHQLMFIINVYYSHFYLHNYWQYYMNSFIFILHI